MQLEGWTILVLIAVCIVLFLLLCYSNQKLTTQSESLAQLDS